MLMILAMALGCSDKNRVPSGVLPRQKMEDVLWDMIQADQYSSFLTKDSAHIHLKEERLRLYEQVFLLHGVSRDQFRKSYDYYMAHPDLTQTLFDSLQAKGNRMRAESYSRPASTPQPTLPAPDTSNKAAMHPSQIPVPGHPMPRPLSPARNGAHAAGDTGHPAPRPERTGHPVLRPLHPLPDPGSKRPVE
jgi:hypothetical protein